MKQRLFIALWPDDGLRSQLVRATHAAVERCGGRPVPARNYHITLAFLGEQPVELVAELTGLLEQIPMPAFSLQLDRYDCWQKPGIFWFGPADWPDSCRLLVTRIDRVLDALGQHYSSLRMRSHDFKPHMTLARKVAALPELDDPVPVEWQVRDFVLVASAVTERGSDYSIIRTFAGGSRHDPKQD